MTDNSNAENDEPNFSAFADWHIHKQADEWPHYESEVQSLTPPQIEIVKRNAELFLDYRKWRAHVAAFEKQLAKILDESERESKRLEFQIRLDWSKFSGREKRFTVRRIPCSISFYQAMFGDGDVLFNWTVFQNGNAIFDRAQFGRGTVSFFQSKFLNGTTRFRGTVFNHSWVTFSDAQFDSSVEINRVAFEHVPDFTGAAFKIPPDVSATKVPPPHSGYWLGPRWRCNNKELVARYRKLKAMALAANDHEKDGEFFAYEMLAKRGVEETNTIGLLVNWFYFILSRFGQSFKRPLFFLSLSFGLSIVPYTLLVRPFLSAGEALSFAISHSARNFLPLLNSLFRFAYRPEDFASGYEKTFASFLAHESTVTWLVNLAIAQNFVGLILLFLLLLGLRNKFRLK